MIKLALQHALRSLKRRWREPTLWILLAALVLAVAATGSVSIFTARVGQALSDQSGDTLGGDVLLSARDPIAPALRQKITAAGVRTSAHEQFPSVVLAGAQSALASLKAVEAGYPLRGTLAIADVLNGPARPAQGVPAPGQAWADAGLLRALAVSVGSVVELGSGKVTITAVIVQEPDRSGGYNSLAPRLMINRQDLAPLGLLAVGSRAQFSLALTGSAEALDLAQKAQLPKGARWLRPQDARPELKSALDRAGQFLEIASLAAALLAAAAVALTASGFGNSLRDEVALLKALGASQNLVLLSLTGQLVAVGILGGLIGVALAWLGHATLISMLGSVLGIALPPASAQPLLMSFALGLVLLLGFGMPPVLAARRTPPTRVLARDDQATPSKWTPVISAITVAGLLLWQSASVKLALWIVLGAGLALLALAVLATGLVWALNPLRHRASSAWRFGLANIARRKASSVGQVVALGLALLALMLMSVVRQDLLETWRLRLPASTPNQFLINIQTEQVAPLQAFLHNQGIDDAPVWPMIRARLTALRGQAITPQTFDDPETQRWINREFNVSSTQSFGSDNQLMSGQWWDASAVGKPLLSVDEYAVERLNLKLGDTLTLDIAGTTHTLTVYNIRKVSWDSFKPNFFLVTPPEALQANNVYVPMQWISSFYLPPNKNEVLNDLVRNFNNITPIDIAATLLQVRNMVDKVVNAVEMVFVFALIAGLLVMLAAMEGSRLQRSREVALLRTLGASSRQLRLGLISEYAILGAVAGVLAAIAAQGIAWILATQVLQMPYGPRPLIWLLGALGGGGLVALLGVINMRAVINTPPRAILR